MKKLLLSIVFLALSVTTVSAKETVINLGLGFNSSYAPWMFGIREEFPEVAKRMGLKDVTLKFHDHKSSVQTWPLMLSNQLELIAGSPQSLSLYNLKKPNDVKILATINGGDFHFICRPEIKTIADVRKIKSVAISDRRTHQQEVLMYFGDKWFKDKMFFEDKIVTPVTSQLLQVVASGSGQIDCAVWGTPVQQDILKNYGWNKIGTPDYKALINVWLVRKEWADKNPQIVKALLETYLQVTRKFNENPVPYMELYVKHSGIRKDPVEFAQYYGYKGGMIGFTQQPPADLDKGLRLAEEIGFISSKGYDKIEDLYWDTSLFDKK